MTDGVGIVKTNAQPIEKRSSVYRSEQVREMKARAASVQQDSTPEELNGLKRLNQILGQDKPLRDNVPRGFYLNIRI